VRDQGGNIGKPRLQLFYMRAAFKDYKIKVNLFWIKEEKL